MSLYERSRTLAGALIVSALLGWTPAQAQVPLGAPSNNLETLPSVEQLQAKERELAQAYYMRGLLAMLQGTYAEAVTYMGKALQYDPENDEYLQAFVAVKERAKLRGAAVPHQGESK